MADPQLSLTVGEVTALFTAFGGGIVVLIRTGVLSVGKNNKNNDGQSRRVQFDPDDCEKKHEKLDQVLTKYDEINQTIILDLNTQKQTLKVHKERLEKGDEVIEGIKEDVGSIKGDIGILLDRSGGRPGG